MILVSHYSRCLSEIFVASLAACLLIVMSGQAVAQEGAVGSQAKENISSLSPGDQDKLQALALDLDAQRTTITDLEKRAENSAPHSESVLQLRLARAWTKLLKQGTQYASVVYDLRDQGSEQSPYWGQATSELNTHPDVAKFAAELYESNIATPPEEMTAVEQASFYARLFQLYQAENALYELVFESIEVAEDLQLNTEQQRAMLRARLANRSANNSVLLDLAIDDVAAQLAGLDVLPDDADLQAQLAVAQNRVAGLASSLQSTVSLMDAMDMDTTVQREQVILATGSISSDTLNTQVLGNLLSRWGQETIDSMREHGPNVILQLVIFLIILLAARKLARVVERMVGVGLDRSGVTLSHLLRNMVLSVARNIVLVVGFLIALSQVGISLGPVLAGLGVAGFVVGFALQDTLSNFASGMMILLYRPFDTGDVIEAGGVSGKVNHMSLVNTTILTLDNQTIIVPNNIIWGGVIKNVTAQRMRRVDLVFGVSYSDDLEKVKRVLEDIVGSESRVLEEPAPMVRLHELADSSVNFVVRPWVKTEDYWEAYWALTSAVKTRFDEEHISIPFPQRDVHIDTNDPALPCNGA